MTAPAMPAAPAVRAPSPGGGGGATGAGSAAPFASALDGALSEGRAAVGEGSGEDAEQQDPGTPAGTVVPVEAGAPVATTPVGLTAALWALGLGVAPPAAVDGDPAPAGGVTPVAGTAAGGVPAAGLPAVPTPATPAPAGAAPATTAPTGAAPATTAPTGAAPATTAAPGFPGALPAADPAAAPIPTAAPTPTAPAAGPAPRVPDLVPAAVEGSPPVAGTAAGPASTPATSAPAAPTGAVAPAGNDAGSGAAASGSEPAEAPSAVPGAVPAVPVAPTADVDGPAGTAADLPVAGQVARHVAVLRGAPDGSHTMTLVLTPDTLGPVEVSVTVSDGTVDLVLRGAHEHGRAALLDALPDLRRDLEGAGLTTSRMTVDRETGGSWLARHHAEQQAQQGQQGSGQRPGQQEPGDGRSRPWLRPADSESSRSVPSTRSTSSGVDIRV